MPKIDKDKIMGYEADNDYYCLRCAESRGIDDSAKHDDLLTAESMSREEVFYCKDCSNRIGSGNGRGSGGGLF